MEAYIGTICAFGFNFAPYGWQYCNGQIMPISQYSALFSLLGTYYGGNGTSTFGLPNLQGRSTLHQGQHAGGSLYVIGEAGGVTSATILTSNMPAHTHTIGLTIKGDDGNAQGGTQVASPVNAYPSTNPNGPIFDYNPGPATPNTYMKPASVTIGNSGGTVAISVSDPTLVMNYCVAMNGVFPTRN